MQAVRTHLFVRRLSTLLLVAAVLLSMTLSFFVSPAAALAASREAKIYIKIAVTETKTTVGQQPKIVLTFGNNGGKTFTGWLAFCYDSHDLFDGIEQNAVYHQLIPGQNDNVTIRLYAHSAGTTNLRCDITGYYSDASGDHTAYAESNTVKVVVKNP